MTANWQPQSNLPELDSRLENAFKRVSGLAGFRIGQDRMNTDALRSTAANIVDVSVSGAGPFFMRLGQSLGSACSYRPKGQISLKEIAAEVLNEFYNEGVAAFQAAKISLHTSAAKYLTEAGMDESSRNAVLESVDKSFMDPSREEMTMAAMPYVNVTITPGTLACIGLVAGMALGLVALRHPLFMLIGGIIGGGGAYCVARSKLREKAGTLLTRLPQDIYTILRQNLIANETRYIDLVNQSVIRH
ncbi:hypothetical protein C4J81_11960 [Deltaproteobacteria bacterium Smac51]|nr:hypothetical protein C4J81_11960 [Deltaproteobacteria bacterium Smac51]